MAQPVTKERLEAAKQRLIGLEQEVLDESPTLTAIAEEATPEPPPFGGGHLVGLMVNPSSIELQQLPGYDKYGFSFSRSYGGSTYLPLIEHCKRLIESESPAMQMAGHSHLADRFMVARDTSPPFTIAEKMMYDQAHLVGQQLFDKGAVHPIVFTRVEVQGHFGPDILKNHYIPSCGTGVAPEEIITSFLVYLSKPDRWTLEYTL